MRRRPEALRPYPGLRKLLSPEPNGLEGVPPAVLDAWRATQAGDEDAPDFLTIEQIGRARGISEASARRFVRANIARMERRLVRRAGLTGRLILVNVYRLKEEK